MPRKHNNHNDNNDNNDDDNDDDDDDDNNYNNNNNNDDDGNNNHNVKLKGAIPNFVSFFFPSSFLNNLLPAPRTVSNVHAVEAKVQTPAQGKQRLL